MNTLMKILMYSLPPLVLLLALGGCSCGFDCNNDRDNNNDNNPARLSLGFSDSLPEDLTEVVIEVDTITLRRSGVEDIVIETFTIPALNLVDEPTFQMDLLDYPGTKQLVVITDLELIPGSYNEVSIAILTSDENQSYVQKEDDDNRKALKVTNGFRSLPGIQLASGNQPFTVEFSLAQALQYIELTDTYLLTTDGVRIEDNLTAAKLTGTVEDDLFNSVSPCDEKTSPTKGNRVYLYQGTDLLEENLADVFTSQSTEPPPLKTPLRPSLSPR